MKLILIGANGKHWRTAYPKALAGAGHEIVKVDANQAISKSRSRTAKVVGKLYQAVGSFDAVANETDVHSEDVG